MQSDLVTPKPTPDSIRLVFYAVLLTLGASLAYSIMGALVKLISIDTTNSTIVFFRFAIGLILLLPLLTCDKITNRPLKLKTKRPILHLIRGLAGLLTLLLLYYSIKFIPLVDAVLLNTTYPIFIPIIYWLIMRVSTSWKTWIGVLLGFIGIAFVLKPGHELFDTASIMALLSGITAAIAIVSTRILSKTESPRLITFYYFVLTTIISAFLVAIDWHMPSLYTLIILLAIGLVATLYQIFLTSALSKAPARLVSPLMYSAIIFSGIIGWLFWGNVPDMFSLIGTLLVFTGATIAVFTQK